MLGGARPVAEPKQKRTDIPPCFGPWASIPVFCAAKKANPRPGAKKRAGALPHTPFSFSHCATFLKNANLLLSSTTVLLLLLLLLLYYSYDAVFFLQPAWCEARPVTRNALPRHSQTTLPSFSASAITSSRLRLLARGFAAVAGDGGVAVAAPAAPAAAAAAPTVRYLIDHHVHVLERFRRVDQVPEGETRAIHPHAARDSSANKDQHSQRA